MRRALVGLALTTGVVLVTALPAQAAAGPNPVKVMEAQLSAKKGAEVASTTSMSVDGKLMISFKEKGKVQLGKGSDLTFKGDLGPAIYGAIAPEDFYLISALTDTSRVITVGKESYVSGGLVRNALPTGMTWLRFDKPVDSPGAPPIDILAAGTLKTLLAGAAPKGGVAKGTISVAKLRSVAPRLRTFATKGTVSWTLQFDAKGLVKRFSATLPSVDGVSIKTETRVSRWGSVTVSPPPGDQVFDADALGESVPIPDPIAEANK
ncbi:hypothetical protein [Nonomuraea dietziae]|uniref:hypothetical protein n=1 Tax=Nonomuraea dietziae TaxID=65515 RepID=UPI0034397C9B